MPKPVFEFSARHDFLILAQHDPTILTWRHCTSEDVRRLGALAGFDHIRAKRAFNCCLFQRTKYLKLSLDPSFEPKAECRERAARILKERAEKKAQKNQTAQPIPVQQPKPLGKTMVKLKPSKIARYSF